MPPSISASGMNNSGIAHSLSETEDENSVLDSAREGEDFDDSIEGVRVGFRDPFQITPGLKLLTDHQNNLSTADLLDSLHLQT